MTSSTIDYLTSETTYSVIIVGMGGSGKTSLVWSLFDQIIDGMILAYRYPEEVIGSFPFAMRTRIRRFDEWSEIVHWPGNILFDDSVLTAGSRDSAHRTNKDLQANMTILRHNNKRLWWTVQNTAMLDRLAFQSIDPITLHKWMPLEQIWTEREELIDYQIRANEAIETVVSLIGADRRSLTYCPRFDEVIQTDLPEWWCDRVSTPYRGYYVRDGKIIRG